MPRPTQPHPICCNVNWVCLNATKCSGVGGAGPWGQVEQVWRAAGVGPHAHMPQQPGVCRRGCVATAASRHAPAYCHLCATCQPCSACLQPPSHPPGTWKNTEDYAAAPNIDHTQERVRRDLIEWMRYLRQSIGFDGWRFDYVKVRACCSSACATALGGMACRTGRPRGTGTLARSLACRALLADMPVPPPPRQGYEGKWVREYIDATVPQMAFGEYWDTCAYTGASGRCTGRAAVVACL